MPRAATAAARTAPVEAPRRAPRRAQPARRSSGPAAPTRSGRAGAATRRKAAPRAVASHPSISRSALAVAGAGVRALPLPQRLEFPRLGPAATALLDRLLRGRAWVLLIGTLLVGIVFFNVDVLRLNRSIAATSERATALKQENARLLLLEAKLASSERIQQQAAADGMVLPAPGEVRYLSARHGDAARAAARIAPPAPVPPPAATPQTEQTPGTAAPAPPPPSSGQTVTSGTSTGAPVTGTGTDTTTGTGTSTGTPTTGTTTGTGTGTGATTPATGTPSTGGAAPTGSSGG